MPILQALSIVKDTAGNVIVGQVVSTVHDRVKEGDPIAPTLKASGVFPAMVAGMVDVGEQTGALPEMLMKIADNYDDEVDNAVSAMTSLLEPIMIVFLALVVGQHRGGGFPAPGARVIVYGRNAGCPLMSGRNPAQARSYSRAFESMMMVTGPSFARLTSMWAPNSPVWMGRPKSCPSRSMNFS